MSKGLESLPKDVLLSSVMLELFGACDSRSRRATSPRQTWHLPITIPRCALPSAMMFYGLCSINIHLGKVTWWKKSELVGLPVNKFVHSKADTDQVSGQVNTLSRFNVAA